MNLCETCTHCHPTERPRCLASRAMGPTCNAGRPVRACPMYDPTEDRRADVEAQAARDQERWTELAERAAAERARTTDELPVVDERQMSLFGDKT